MLNSIFFVATSRAHVFPGRTCRVVNDRLRRKTGIYASRRRLLYMISLYDVKRPETDSVYGGRAKIRRDLQINSSAPYTEIKDCRIRSYITVCVVYGRLIRNLPNINVELSQS